MQRHRPNAHRCQAWLAAAAMSLAPMSLLGQTSPSGIDQLPTAPTIEVFTTAGEPVTNVPPGTAVIELDAPARLDAELSQGLPADPAAAEAAMRERMQLPEWNEVVQRYGELHIGVTRAWVLRVEKVPAVVVGGEHVVYGQPDVGTAVQEILEARGEGAP